jgi:hypothetical protein
MQMNTNVSEEASACFCVVEEVASSTTFIILYQITLFLVP